MSMEILFKSGKYCRSPCIAENIASFFGNNQDDFEKLCCEMRYFWDIRNNIAHEGSSCLDHHEINKLNKKLREYVRKSIVKVDKNGKNKNEIIESLENKFNKIDCP